jgi:hypothetical protein
MEAWTFAGIDLLENSDKSVAQSGQTTDIDLSAS